MRYIVFFLWSLCCCINAYAQIRVDNVSDYHFGMIRPGSVPLKEATLWVSAAHYTLVIHGHSDLDHSFHLANGLYKVPYTISWQDTSGVLVNVLPNTISQVFSGEASGKAAPARLHMRINGNFPKPGHYSDTLTLIISPV